MKLLMNSCTSENMARQAAKPPSRVRRRLAIAFASLAACWMGPLPPIHAQSVELPPRGWIVHVPLPIQGEDDLRIRADIQSVIDQTEQQEQEHGESHATRPTRPTLVLSFTAPEQTDESLAANSQFERCLSLARFLTQPRVSRLRTVALLQGAIVGHAVLPVLACEEIVVEQGATLGPVSSDAPEQAVAQAYLDIASRRRTAPPALARALVDPLQHLLAVETLDELSVIPQSELAALQQTTTVVSIQTLTRPGSALVLAADQLRQLHAADLIVEDRAQLAPALGLAALERPVGKSASRAIIWRLHGVLRESDLKAQRAELASLAAATENVLVLLDINSPGGSPAAAARLANLLSQCPSHVRTLAFVQQARADAWLLAAACGRVVASSNAVFGGDGASSLSEREASALGAVAAAVARRRGRLASLAAGLVDRNVTIHLYQHNTSGLQQPRSDDEHAQLPSRGQWRRVNVMDLRPGVTGAAAMRWGQVDQLADSLAEALEPYGFAAEQLNERQPNWIITQVERFGGLPWLPQLLVSIGCFALLVEFSSPGIGAAGFLSALCFVLFFWIQFLNGTADYLEAAMFVTGLLCLAFELLVLPGFGVFGFGGIIMLLSSLVLASQTFVLPTNAYQWAQTPQSVGSLAAALLGIFGGAYAISRLLPNTPGLRALILNPPAEADAPGRWDYLQGKLGVTQTPLRPGGKAAFGDEVVDVLSSGGLIEADRTVIVERVQGTRIIVATHDNNMSRATDTQPLPPEEWGELFDD